MNGARVAITIDEQPNGVRIACFLTEDPQIDYGLRSYLERYGLELDQYKPDVVGSQMFTVTPSPDRSIEWTLGLIQTYYISWGKEPSVQSMS